MDCPKPEASNHHDDLLSYIISRLSLCHLLFLHFHAASTTATTATMERQVTDPHDELVNSLQAVPFRSSLLLGRKIADCHRALLLNRSSDQ